MKPPFEIRIPSIVAHDAPKTAHTRQAFAQRLKTSARIIESARLTGASERNQKGRKQERSEREHREHERKQAGQPQPRSENAPLDELARNAAREYKLTEDFLASRQTSRCSPRSTRIWPRFASSTAERSRRSDRTPRKPEPLRRAVGRLEGGVQPARRTRVRRQDHLPHPRHASRRRNAHRGFDPPKRHRVDVDGRGLPPGSSAT